MSRHYAKVLIPAILLVVILTSSGCYTVLKMRTGMDYGPDYDSYEVYDYWYDPFYSYHPYHFYFYTNWYYHPWTYWCCDPYWTYPYYWRTHSYCYDPYDYAASQWQKSKRRRGIETRTITPRYAPEGHIISSRDSGGGETKGLKKLRKIGIGTSSKSTRRSGVARTPSSISRPVSTSTSSVSRQTSSTPRSSKASTSSHSSSPTRRRGSKH